MQQIKLLNEREQNEEEEESDPFPQEFWQSK